MEAAVEEIVRRVVKSELAEARREILDDVRELLQSVVVARAPAAPAGPAPEPTTGGESTAPGTGMMLLVGAAGEFGPTATGGAAGPSGTAAGAGPEAAGTSEERKRGWSEAMEKELTTLLHEQTKGEVVAEDRIQWQVIRAMSKTMGHLSKDAIRKKGKRMLHLGKRHEGAEGHPSPASEQAKRRRKAPAEAEAAAPPAAAHHSSALQQAGSAAAENVGLEASTPVSDPGTPPAVGSIHEAAERK